MRPFAVSLLSLAVLLTACSGGAKPATAPTVPAAPESAPAQPEQKPATQPADRIPLPQINIGQVTSVDLWAPTPANPQVRLDPQQDGALLQPLLTALQGAGGARLRNDSGNVSLTATVRLRTGERLILALNGPSEPVAATWQDQELWIDAPTVGAALVALEPALGKAQKPGIQIWAVDLAGGKGSELLLEHPQDLMLAGASPDGRYLLLTEQLGQYKGDYTAVPYLLDRTSGKLTAGSQTLVRTAAWSGNGFYIDYLSHLDLGLHETHLDQLAAALQLKADEREIISISYPAGGRRFAALVGRRQSSGEPLDLVLGNRDGTDLTVLPKAVFGADTQIGTVAGISLSPDGQYAALTDKAGAALIRVADPEPQQWLRLSVGGLGGSWAPDSRHVWFASGEVVDLSGNTVLTTGQVYNLLWQADGQGGVIAGYDGIRSFRIGGAQVDVPAPAWALATGYLPDGRLLVWRTVHPR